MFGQVTDFQGLESLSKQAESLNLDQKVLESAGIWLCNILYLNAGLLVLVLDNHTLCTCIIVECTLNLCRCAYKNATLG